MEESDVACLKMKIRGQEVPVQFHRLKPGHFIARLEHRVSVKADGRSVAEAFGRLRTLYTEDDLLAKGLKRTKAPAP